MNALVYEQIAREHLEDLRREAARYGRAASRADRARSRPVRRAVGFALHRRPVALGCEA